MSDSTIHFADRLTRAIDNKKTPLMVGIDPRIERLPADLQEECDGIDAAQTATAFEKFGCEIIDVVAPLVAAVKPQAAFFEMLGPPGMVALGRVIDYAVDNGLLVILDGKRNDIGTTAAAYAAGWLGRKPHSPWGCDALTINPYLGDDSLQPMIDRAVATGSGLFALVKTSNPGSNTFQELACADGPLYRHVARWVQDAAEQTAGDCGYGAIGAVAGATHPQHLAELLHPPPPQHLRRLPHLRGMSLTARSATYWRLEVLDSERTRFEAELDESATLQAYLSSIVELYKALGGGWREPQPTP